MTSLEGAIYTVTLASVMYSSSFRRSMSRRRSSEEIRSEFWIQSEQSGIPWMTASGSGIGSVYLLGQSTICN